ncbi:MAG: HAD family hydrolase [Ruminococcus sp.]|nr:HAD family hydrolase [Ruminococcus sp.]MDD7338253.1 HAD family hydrolase [Ruminococcus sp.]
MQAKKFNIKNFSICPSGVHGKIAKVFDMLFLLGIVLMILSFIKISAIPGIVYTLMLYASIIMTLLPTAAAAFEKLKEGTTDENALIIIAVLIFALLGSRLQAVSASILFAVFKKLESMVRHKNSQSIITFSNVENQYANVVTSHESVESVPAQKVAIGTNIVIYPHSVVPIDCKVLHGSSRVIAPTENDRNGKEISAGDEIPSGSTNTNETLIAKTTKTYADSAATLTKKALRDAAHQKSKLQKTVSKISFYYVPAIICLAIITALLPAIITHEWTVWTLRAAVLLAASCPGTAVLCVTTEFLSGIRNAAKFGVLVNSSACIENAAKAKCAAFEKSAVESGNMLCVDEVTSPVGLNSKAVLLLAAGALYYSSSPSASAIKSVAPEIDEKYISGYNEIPGHGAFAIFAGKNILCADKETFKEYGIPSGGRDGILVALDSKLVGIITLKTQAKPSVQKGIAALRSSGIGRIIMLTSDSESAARAVAKYADVDEYHAALTDEERNEWLTALGRRYGEAFYIKKKDFDTEKIKGVIRVSREFDGNADISLSGGGLVKLSEAVRLFKKTVFTAKAAVAVCFAVKILIILLTLVGVMPIWSAVMADLLICCLSAFTSKITEPERARRTKK